MEQKISMKLKGFRKILVIITAISVAIVILCIAAPMTAKKNNLTALGVKTVTEMQTLTTAITFFSDDMFDDNSIYVPKNKESIEISKLLGMIALQNDYNRIAILKWGVGGNYTIVGDSNFNRVVTGEEYLSLGDSYPFDIYAGAKSHIDKIQSGDKTESFSMGLTTLFDDVKVATTFLPIYNRDDDVSAVLAIDVKPTRTEYSMLGPINLHYIGMFFATVSVICGLTLYAIFRYLKQAEKNFEPAFHVKEEVQAIDATIVEDESANE